MVIEVEPASANAIFTKYENGIISAWMVTRDGRYTAISPFYALDSSNLNATLKNFSAEEAIRIYFYGVSDGNFLHEDVEPIDIVHLGKVSSGLEYTDDTDRSVAWYGLTGIIERIEVIKDIVIFFVRTKWADEIVIPIFHSNNNSGCKVGDKISCNVLFRCVGIEKGAKDMMKKLGYESTKKYDEITKTVKINKRKSEKKMQKGERKRTSKSKKNEKRRGKHIQRMEKKADMVEGIEIMKSKCDKFTEKEIMSLPTLFCKKEDKKKRKDDLNDYNDYL